MPSSFVFIGIAYNFASKGGESLIPLCLLIPDSLFKNTYCDIEYSVSLLDDITSQFSSVMTLSIPNCYAYRFFAFNLLQFRSN